MKYSLGVNRWQNTTETMEWFNNIKKNEYMFIQFDISDFYPPITENLLMSAINLAKEYYLTTEN